MRHRHYLGTNSTGIDVLATLFGGLQQAVIAAVLFVTMVFATGVLVGGTLGYFGGLLDLVGQRLIEIWSVLPFLFVVMIISSLISPTLTVLVGLLAMFGWMGTTSYLRTATFKERERDYERRTGSGDGGPREGRVRHHHFGNLYSTVKGKKTVRPTCTVAALVNVLLSASHVSGSLRASPRATSRFS